MGTEKIVIITAAIAAIGAGAYFLLKGSGSSDGRGQFTDSGGGAGGDSNPNKETSTNTYINNYYVKTPTQTTNDSNSTINNLPIGTESNQIPAGDSLLKSLSKGVVPTSSQLGMTVQDVVTAIKSGGGGSSKKSSKNTPNVSAALSNVSLAISGANKIVANPVDKSGNKVTQTSPQLPSVKAAAQVQATKTAVKYLGSYKKYF